MNVLAGEILYDVDVTDLKMIDRRKRILSSTFIFIYQMAFILILALIIDIWAIFAFLLILYFLPAPFIPAPAKYKITSQGVKFDERRIFSFKKAYRLRADEKRKFVSILHRWRGEILRLYTPEPKKVMEILAKLLPKSK